jgi:hypothetical protein
VAKLEGEPILVPKIVERKKKSSSKTKYYTIGIGHLLDGSNRSRAAFKKAFPDKKYNEFFKGKGSITRDEAKALFRIDLPDYIAEAKKYSPNIESYSLNLQKHIIGSMFRGMWQQSPKTRALMEADKWDEAGEEFKNTRDYRNAVVDGLPGIIERTDDVVQAIKDEGKRYKRLLKEALRDG